MMSLTGRITTNPSTLLHEEVLEPQFTYELKHMLPWYLLTEKALLLEYERLGAVSRAEAAEIGRLLTEITPANLVADPAANMSDISFAIERYVEQRLSQPAPAWHIDRSRNDFQACAQIMLARDQVLTTAEGLTLFGEAVLALAGRTVELPMPGYTHYQGAQVISPGFYLAAVSHQVLQTLRGLMVVYGDLNRCPLGSGAMAGLELAWDRQRMAELLGFDAPVPHALVAVASREWTLRVAGELSAFSVLLSRFSTDFLFWGSSECGFIDLPDQLSGISSAMPQKKNFPILERIRGKTAHIGGFYVDFMLAQRSTPYTNLVEVSKEASAHLMPLFQTARSVLKLFTTVMEHVRFRSERMQAACEREFYGGFTLANALTLKDGIPYRKAQAIAGRYIVGAMERNLLPQQADAALLADVCRGHGYETTLTEEDLRLAFDVRQNLFGKRTAGSTNPDAVRELLRTQQAELEGIKADISVRRGQISQAYNTVETLLSERREM